MLGRSSRLFCAFPVAVLLTVRAAVSGGEQEIPMSGVEIPPRGRGEAAGSEAPAGPEQPPNAERKLPPVLPPLDFFRNKSPQPDLLLLDKREGFYMTGFPTIGVDPETGFGYGAAVQLFDNGPKDSPFFRYTPYRQRYFIGAQGSTEKVFKAAVGTDYPYILDSPYRLRATGTLLHDPRMNYFGVGEDSMGALNYPGYPGTFDKYEDYQKALEQNVGGVTYARYAEYNYAEASAVGDIERDLFGGIVRPQLGFRASRIWVDDYTGKSVKGATQAETHLAHDARTGRIQGFDGGWDNSLKFGLTLDTRDFEPEPSKGILLQTAGRFSSEAFGSEFDYVQLTFDCRGFQSILKDVTRLVLAGRALYVIEYGDVPFYSMSNIPLTDLTISGLGGWETMRGFPASRFVGEAMALVTGEVRWSFVDFDLWGQHLKLGLAPFVDIGRAFDDPGEATFEDWKIDGGAGLRLAWNLSTVISFDYGVSGEGNFFFMKLGMQF